MPACVHVPSSILQGVAKLLLPWFPCRLIPFDRCEAPLWRPFKLKARISQEATQGDWDAAGWWDCARTAYREEGGRVFFNGMTATLTRAFIVNAAVFSVYEFLVRLMEEHHEVEHRPMI